MDNEITNQDNIFSVSEVNTHVKHIIESNIPNLLIEGEISNFTRHRSGHIYFSLKDTFSTIRCVFFKMNNIYMNFFPKDGDKVICSGKIAVYERGGQYQINISKMYQVGVGKLQLQFERLKEKLLSEGLFDSIHKKELPKFPQKIGIITSSSGAAFQDIKNVLTRRFPVEIILYPVNVQGDKAPLEMIIALKYFNLNSDVDVIIIGRGGGSQEDLFCFNSEMLAREIYASEVPVISAVGHEIDYTIADFVSDLRAPTPSAAAELAVPNRMDFLQYLDSVENKIKLLTFSSMKNYKFVLQSIQQKINDYHPEVYIRKIHQKLDENRIHLLYQKQIISDKQSVLNNIAYDFSINIQKETDKITGFMKNSLQANSQKLINETKKNILSERNNLENLSSRLDELSPYKALKRGYSLIMDKKRIINSVKNLKIGSELNIKLNDGYINAEIKEIKNK